jgi:hypothetical protein
MFVCVLLLCTVCVPSAFGAASPPPSEPVYFTPPPQPLVDGEALPALEFHKPDFIYHGAAVQTEPRLYVLYYGTNWTKTETGRVVKLVLEAFFEGLKNEYEAKGESSWEAILKQYVNVQGEYRSAVYSHTELAPHKETSLTKVTEATVKSLVAEYIAEKKIKTERNDQFLVLPAPGSTYEIAKDECGYHEVVHDESDLAQEYEVTLDPYAKDIPKCDFLAWDEKMSEAMKYQESTLVVASHEFAESVTDPQYLKPEWEKEEKEGKEPEVVAWEDETAPEGGEIADLCNEREKLSFEKGEDPYYHAAQQYSQKGELYANTLMDYHDGKQCQIKDPPAPTPPAPTAETEGADIGSTNATLHGSVNPESAITNYYFEYGTTTGYGSYAPVGPPGQLAGWETSPVAVTASLAGLAPATTYHYRLVASSWVGTTTGTDHTFTTPGWRILTTPKAPGEKGRNDKMVGVSCASGTACEGVGSFLTEESLEAPLSESWNGTSWTVQSAQAPKEAVGTYPEAVSCSSSTACMATGDWDNLEGAEHLFAERLSGGSWSLALPGAPETTSGTLAAVSCPASNECYAAGWYYKTTPHELLPIVERWNGSEWKILTTATLPAEDKEARFSGISCAAAEKCVAVGRYVSETLGIQPLVENLSGTGWSWQTLAGKELISAELASVSCTAPSACTAVGHNHEHTQEALIARYNGTAWSLESSPSPTGKPAELEAEWALTQVSCAAATVCTTTGSYTAPTGEKTKLLGEVWDGTAWSLAPPLPRTGAATNRITGLSCPTERKCFATGYTENSSKTETESLAEELEGA